MQRYSEVIGLPVICADDGKNAGIVKEIIFYPQQKEVKAFLLERKGIEISKRIVNLNDVLHLGRDAVIISDQSCVKMAGKLEHNQHTEDKGEVRGLRVYSKTGEDLGSVEDVLFDHATGIIEGVEVSDGLLQDLVQGRKIIPLVGRVEFSDEYILVDREAVEEIIHSGGGIKNLLDGRKRGHNKDINN